MKSYLIILMSIIFVGCGSNTQQATQNSNVLEPMRTEKLQTTTAHTTENQTLTTPNANASTGSKTKWTQSGDPIDTKEFDAAIAAAEKTLKTKPSDEPSRKALAEAFFKRGFALTEARQYAAALGDYRRALKHDPAHEESKKWIDQIILIYGTLKKDYPKEGEEPPPLPYKGEKS